MEYESVLKEIGGFGRVQKAIFLALSFTSFKAVLDLELMVLTLHESKFRCAQQNSSDYVAQNYSEHCRISRLVGDDTNFTLINETCTKFDYQHGDVISKSMVEEYNLVCDRKHYATGMMSVFFLGCALGMLFGTLGDKIGRKKILIVCGVTDLITTILPAYMPTAETQIFARFLKGFPAAVYYQGLLIMEEMTEEKHRAVLGNLYWLFWCVGYMFSGVVVYIFKEWDKIQLFSTVFCLNYIVIFIVVPESPRWLVLKGRVEEAVDVLKRIAKWNGIKWEHKVSKVKALDVEEEPTGNILDLVTYPEMRMKSIVIFFNLAMFAMCYFGLSTDTTFITTNIVLNVLLNGAVEIPSSFIGWLGSDRYGRKYTTVIITVLSGFCLIAVPIVPTGGVYNIVKAVVAMVGKCLLTTGYCIADVWAAEIFPTSVRNNGLFLATTLAMLSNIVAPVINTLSDVATFLPGLIFGITSIVSALSLLLLPETKGLPLPETVPSSEGLVRGRERQWAIETFSRERAQSLLDDDDMEAVNSQRTIKQKPMEETTIA
ncbi:hypothetical protein BOX15_Mlig033092g1 [Macrostomum lignano]|uniref:Major facilitator superfamily (MFS) profile domain-containing protein n=1 Tax=Macrostomum lignano TaxID=282301 RepID=A0A267GXD4_9PLAT|nr:hypothetical protein BOX15_Mlig033092g1 [Macrostomum lignano]